jgi:hypothetical protein
MALGLRVRAAALVCAGALALACEGPPAAEAARTPLEQLAADSALGDAAAFASLPPSLGPWLDIRPLLTDEALDTLPLAECRALEAVEPDRQRRRLRLRLDDSSVVVLYAVVGPIPFAVEEPHFGRLERVEFIRRTPRQGQRGILWDGDRDRTVSTWWNETAWGLSRRVERGELPRGGPVPRAMRALGRQLFLMPCAETPDDGALSEP